MSLVKLERIVSVSSEDPAFPADNLLKSNYNDKKWKCKVAGDKQISIVIQMNSPVMISGVDVGNYGSAFIEIFVGRSSEPDDFKVLVVASTLMTLQEAKLGENMSNVRFFKEDSLSKPVALEKWDRIKLVCSQPYNKFIQYGLSFIVVHSKSDIKTDTPPISILGNFILRPKDEINTNMVGGIFSKNTQRKGLPISNLNSSAASSVRAASASGIINKRKPSNTSLIYDSSSGGDNIDNHSLPVSNNNATDGASSPVLRKDDSKKPKTPKGVVNAAHNKSPVQSTTSSSSRQATKRPSADDREKGKKKFSTIKRLEKPFNQLMAGVVFTISGFQNPYRSDLRSKAIAMGAKYKPDWDRTCTHLLCAFANTPKFNQVLIRGKIVTKDWIENSYSRRMRLPWRRFALHPPDKNLPESEEEIFEYIPCPNSPLDNRRRLSPGHSSGEGTDEEIERILKNKISKENKTASNNERCGRANNSMKEESSTTSCESTDLEKNVQESLNSEKVISPEKQNKKIFQKINQRNEIGALVSPEKKQIGTEINASTIAEGCKLKSLESTLESNPLQCDDDEPRPGCNSFEEDIYEMDTDDENWSPHSKQYGLYPLLVFYDKIKFYIGLDLDKEERKKIERYIVAHKGSVLEKPSKDVKFIISRSAAEVKTMELDCPEAKGIEPEWVWMCHDQNRFAPTLHFEIN